MSAAGSFLMPSPLSRPPHDITVTPSAADAWHECSYRVGYAQKGADASESLRRGIVLHDLFRLDTRRHLSRLPELVPEELVMRACGDEALKQDPDFLSFAAAFIVGARRFLADYGLIPLQPERYVRSAYRVVANAPSVRVRFSGKIDLVARNSHGGLTLLDYKTGRAIPNALDLSSLPSSFVYTYLGRCLRSQDEHVAAVATPEIEIVQVLPHQGVFSAASLTQEEMQAGADVVRAMVVEMAEKRFTPTPGEYCAYCPFKDTCPVGPSTTDWEQEPF